MTDNSTLFNNAKWSDFKITSESRKSDTRPCEWHAHSAVVCPRSGFFAACLDPTKAFKESRDRIVVLRDVNGGPEVVDAALGYMYTSDYDDTAYAGMPLLLNLRVHAFADFLQMADDGLDQLSFTKFKKAAETDWSHPSFAATIRLLYSNAQMPSSKKGPCCKVVRSVAVDHVMDLCNVEIDAHADFRRALEDTPRFASELFMDFFGHHLHTTEVLTRKLDEAKNETASLSDKLQAMTEQLTQSLMAVDLLQQGKDKIEADALANIGRPLPDEARYCCPKCNSKFTLRFIKAKAMVWCPRCGVHYNGSVWKNHAVKSR